MDAYAWTLVALHGSAAASADAAGKGAGALYDASSPTITRYFSIIQSSTVASPEFELKAESRDADTGIDFDKPEIIYVH